MEYHPGGIPEIMRGVGKDGTDLFDEVWNRFFSLTVVLAINVNIKVSGLRINFDL